MEAKKPERKRDKTYLGDHIKARRGSRSIQDVARKVGIDATTLRRIEENTIADVRFGLIVALAKELRFSLDALAADAGMLDADRDLAPLGLAAEDLGPVADAIADAARAVDVLRARAPKRG